MPIRVMRDVDCGRDSAAVMLPLGGAPKVKPAAFGRNAISHLKEEGGEGEE